MTVPDTVRPTPDTTGQGSWPKRRAVLIRIWAGLLTLQVLLMAQGIAVLLLGDVDPGMRFVAATSTVFKILSLGGAAWVLWSAGRSVSAYWMIAVGQLAWAASDLLAPQVDGNPPLLDLANVVIFYGPLVALRPRRKELLRPQFQPRALTVAVAATGSCALMTFAWHLATASRSDELSFDAVGLYVTLAFMSLFAAARPAGGRWLIPLVSAAAAATAAAAFAFPDDFASPGHLGAAMLLLWALALVGAATAPASMGHPAVAGADTGGLSLSQDRSSSGEVHG